MKPDQDLLNEIDLIIDNISIGREVHEYQTSVYVENGDEIKAVILQWHKKNLSINNDFQRGVKQWLIECFGIKISSDQNERCHRFIEESIELVQSLGCTKEDVLMLVDYVYGRPIGDPYQEVGGVMVTLAALCSAVGLDMRDNGNTELIRIIGKMPEIRAKQATKPQSSPLPQ